MKKNIVGYYSNPSQLGGSEVYLKVLLENIDLSQYNPLLFLSDTHPLKGNLYETMILSELIKNRFNQGMINNLLFYRDSNGNEVDVVIPHGNSYTVIEIKASKTITNRFFKGLNDFDNLQSESVRKLLIHSGDIIRKQSGIQITNLKSLEDHIKEEN